MKHIFIQSLYFAATMGSFWVWPRVTQLDNENKKPLLSKNKTDDDVNENVEHVADFASSSEYRELFCSQKCHQFVPENTDDPLHSSEPISQFDRDQWILVFIVAFFYTGLLLTCIQRDHTFIRKEYMESFVKAAVFEANLEMESARELERNNRNVYV
jgi:hypothetical protein